VASITHLKRHLCILLLQLLLHCVRLRQPARVCMCKLTLPPPGMLSKRIYDGQVKQVNRLWRQLRHRRRLLLPG
jgi:hypothetical protein